MSNIHIYFYTALKFLINTFVHVLSPEVSWRHTHRVFMYLHSIAEVRAGSDGHHGQQASAGSDVQDNDPLISSLQSSYGSPDALIVLLILKDSEVFSSGEKYEQS